MKTIALCIASLFVVTACSATDEPTDRPGPENPGLKTQAKADPGAGRVESFRGVEITVPASWGNSVAPMGTDSDGDLEDCGSGVPEEASVGRPGMTSDACTVLGVDDLEPTAPFVW